MSTTTNQFNQFVQDDKSSALRDTSSKLNWRRKTIDGYFSFELIARGYKLNPQWAFSRWLSEPTTLEFISLWEKLHNPLFNNEVYLSIAHNALSCATFPSLEELKLKAKISSMYCDLDFPDEIYMHRDIACDFASWASPAFRAYCLQNLSCGSNNTVNFYSEEDFVVSSNSLAKNLYKASISECMSEAKNNDNDKDYSLFEYFSKMYPKN